MDIIHNTAGPVDYYVYYRISAKAGNALSDTIERIRAMQTGLAARTGIQGRLMRRRDDDATLMEIYPAVTDTTGFEVALEAEVETFDIGALIEPGSARHIERFVTCA